jgi:hypothetical protein
VADVQRFLHERVHHQTYWEAGSKQVASLSECQKERWGLGLLLFSQEFRRTGAPNTHADSNFATLLCLQSEATGTLTWINSAWQSLPQFLNVMLSLDYDTITLKILEGVVGK